MPFFHPRKRFQLGEAPMYWRSYKPGTWNLQRKGWRDSFFFSKLTLALFSKCIETSSKQGLSVPMQLWKMSDGKRLKLLVDPVRLRTLKSKRLYFHCDWDSHVNIPWLTLSENISKWYFTEFVCATHIERKESPLREKEPYILFPSQLMFSFLISTSSNLSAVFHKNNHHNLVCLIFRVLQIQIRVCCIVNYFLHYSIEGNWRPCQIWCGET